MFQDGRRRRRGALWVFGRYRWAEWTTSEWRTLEVIPSDSTHVTVHGLRPSSTYIFTLLARSKLTYFFASSSSSSPHTAATSTGQFSNVVNASTKGPASFIICRCYAVAQKNEITHPLMR